MANTVHASFRLRPDVVKRLTEVAEKEDRTKPRIIERALLDYFAKHDKKEATSG
jgi:predicted transcriptional regulator